MAEKARVSSREGLPRYVIDTHALHWYLLGDPKLGMGAKAAIKLVELGEAQLIIPAIVLAELINLSIKHRKPLPLKAVAEAIANNDNIQLAQLGFVQLTAFETLTASLEMHDRLILADAVLIGATLITKDRALRDCGLVPIIW